MALYVNGKKVAGIGLPGKSAYQYAVDGGYMGTEEEFQEVLANAGSKGGNPPGTILWYASKTPPDGYLVCNGSVISRTDYADLFSVIGTTFGAGDGSTTFALPNLQAAFIRGSGSRGQYKAEFGKFQDATAIYTNTTFSGSLDNQIPTRLRYISSQDSEQNTGYSHMYREDSSGSPGETQQGKIYTVRPVNIALTPIIKF